MSPVCEFKSTDPFLEVLQDYLKRTPVFNLCLEFPGIEDSRTLTGLKERFCLTSYLRLTRQSWYLTHQKG